MLEKVNSPEDLKKLNLKEKNILAYEIWSGAGSESIIDTFEVKHDLKVNGVPRYEKTTIYPIAYCLGRSVLTLKEIQRLLYFGRSQSTWRDITFGTGFRTMFDFIDKKETRNENKLLWVSNNPLD